MHLRPKYNFTAIYLVCIFPNLKPGLYVLNIQAFNRKTDVHTVKRGFEINSDPNYCSLVLVNRGVTVSEDGSSAEMFSCMDLPHKHEYWMEETHLLVSIIVIDV